MRVGRPEQQSNIIRHLAHELAPGPPRDVSPVPYPSERCPAGMRDATEHFEVRVLPRHTPVSLIVVDDALGVFRVDVDPELCEGGVRRKRRLGRFAEAMELMYTGGHTGKLLVNVAAATGSA